MITIVMITTLTISLAMFIDDHSYDHQLYHYYSVTIFIIIIINMIRSCRHCCFLLFVKIFEARLFHSTVLLFCVKVDSLLFRDCNMLVGGGRGGSKLINRFNWLCGCHLFRVAVVRIYHELCFMLPSFF